MRQEERLENVQRPIVLAVINMKGGTGKTTLAVNLAYFASRQDKRTLLVDLDPQASASIYTLGRDAYRNLLDSGTPTIYELFERFIPGRPSVTLANAVRQVQRNWDLLPSKLAFAWVLKSPTGREHALQRLLEDEAGDYSFVVIDCPPTESVFTTAAYLASEWVLIPVGLEPLASVGFPLLDLSLNEFMSLYGRRPQVAGIAFVHLEREDPWAPDVRAEVTSQATAATVPTPIFDREMPWSRSFVRGSTRGTTIAQTPYARWNKISEMRQLAEQIFRRIGLIV